MGASLVAQLVKNLSAMQENWVQSLDWTIPGWDLAFLTSVLEITGCGLSPLSLPLAFSTATKSAFSFFLVCSSVVKPLMTIQWK